MSTCSGKVPNGNILIHIGTAPQSTCMTLCDFLKLIEVAPDDADFPPELLLIQDIGMNFNGTEGIIVAVLLQHEACFNSTQAGTVTCLKKVVTDFVNKSFESNIARRKVAVRKLQKFVHNKHLIRTQ